MSECDEKLVERVAREIYSLPWSSMGGWPETAFKCLPDAEREAFLEQARAVVPLVEKATLERVAPLVAYCKWKIDMDPSVGLDDERLIGDALAALDSLGEGEE